MRLSIEDRSAGAKAVQGSNSHSNGGRASPLAESAELQAAEAEVAEAEARAAEARAVAARAKARALRAAQADVQGEAQTDTAARPESDGSPTLLDLPPQPKRRSWLPGWKASAAGVAAVLVCALAVLSGWFLWVGDRAAQRRAQEAEFTAAARQGAINLMSLDFNHGPADVQRLIDSMTGQFRDDFVKSKDDFLAVMKDSKVVAKAEVKSTAVESMTDDSATVLVAATSTMSNSVDGQQPPRSWRLSITVQRDQGQFKVSKVEFVP
jgi:Mce-associated membrane protein